MAGKLIFDMRQVKESISLIDGTQIARVDTLGRKDLTEPEAARNIFAFSEGKMLWRVHSKFDDQNSGPFTKLTYEGHRLSAYRWDGGEYDIDVATGFATPGQFLK